MTLEHELVIDRPIAVVWAFMEDFHNYPRWQSGLVAMRPITDGPIAEGTRIAVVHQFLGRRLDLILEVLSYEPRRTFAARVTAGPIRFTGTWRYEAVDSTRTRISGVIVGDTEGFFKLADAVVARAAKRQIDADCATLKDLIESSAVMAAR